MAKETEQPEKELNEENLNSEEGKQEETAETVAEETQSEEGEETSEEKLKAELAEFKDKYLRLYSEFENFRRRTNKEKIEFLKTANKDLIVALLPILDDYLRADKAFDKANTTTEQVKEGYELIFKKLKTTLEKQGLKEIKNPSGEVFDTEYHEAVTQFPAPSKDMKGKVVDELEKGYMLGDKVVRFTKVVVGM